MRKGPSARTMIFLVEPFGPRTMNPSISTLSPVPTGRRVATLPTKPGVGEGVGVWVGVGTGLGVGVGVGVGVTLDAGVGVGLGVGVAGGVGVGVGVDVGPGVGVGVGVEAGGEPSTVESPLLFVKVAAPGVIE